MSKKILVGLMTLVLAIGLVGAGAFAVFSDVETSEDNTFTAGTLDLKVDSVDDPVVQHCELADLRPGDYGNYDSPGRCSRPEVAGLIWTVKNAGSINGNFWIEIVNIVNYENGQNEPEALVDPSAGEFEGELGQGTHMYFAYYINGNWKSCGSGIDEFSRGVKNQSITLAPNQEATICIGWNLKDRGAAIDNKIQSDSLEFDIIFHLDQAP